MCRDNETRGRYSCRLACLHLHVVRAYCNFESKQVHSITLFGRRPNNKEELPGTFMSNKAEMVPAIR